MAKASRETSVDPLDCLSEVVEDLEPQRLGCLPGHETIKGDFHKRLGSSPSGQAVSVSESDGRKLKSDRQEEIKPDKRSITPTMSLASRTTPPPTAPSKELEDQVIELPSDYPTPVSNVQASVVLPPISAAGIVSSENAGRVEVAAESEHLPSAAELVASIDEDVRDEHLRTAEQEQGIQRRGTQDAPAPNRNEEGIMSIPPAPPEDMEEPKVEKHNSPPSQPEEKILDQEDVDMDASAVAEAEGEEELDIDDQMEIDEVIDSQGPVNNIPSYLADTTTPASPSSGSSTPVPQRKKPGPKPKGDKGKLSSAPTSSKTAAIGSKGIKGKGKTKVEDLKAFAAASSNSQASGSNKARSVSVADSIPASVSANSDQTPLSEDTELYCLCKKVFDEEDEEGVMVGCDGCENWFHPSCIKIKEEDVPLVDLYICPMCEQTTSQRTTWKRICRKDGCENSVTGKPSKYCSSSCAFQHMAGQIPPQASNKLLKQLSAAFIGLPRPVMGISTINHKPSAAAPPRSLPDPVSAIQKQLDHVNAAIELVQKRQKVLEQVIARCDTLAAVQIHTAASSKPGKKKGAQRSGGEDRPCGWMERLIWDDEEVANWDETPPPDEEHEVPKAACMNPRRRCDRHQGWQKTMSIAAEAELVQLERQKEVLEMRLEQNRPEEKGDTSNEAREVVKRYLASQIVEVS